MTQTRGAGTDALEWQGDRDRNNKDSMVNKDNPDKNPHQNHKIGNQPHHFNSMLHAKARYICITNSHQHCTSRLGHSHLGGELVDEVPRQALVEGLDRLEEFVLDLGAAREVLAARGLLLDVEKHRPTFEAYGPGVGLLNPCEALH